MQKWVCLFLKISFVDFYYSQVYNIFKKKQTKAGEKVRQYDITGMSCAACSARVEKAVLALSGVSECSVNLLTNSMSVEGEADDKQIIDAVKKAGYGASIKGEKKEEEKGSFSDEITLLKKRLFYSLGFLLVLMYFSMGHTMWGFPVPEFFENNHIAMGILQMLLSLAVMIINKKFFINGFSGLVKGSPNMDSLVAIGSGASFVYSVYALFMMTRAEILRKSALSLSYMHEFYFEGAAMILTLITVGKLLEARSKGKTSDAIKSLMKLSPETAVVIRDEKEVTIKITEVLLGDIFVVRPGERIPVDGIVIDGESAVDESALTGESVPYDKKAGDEVYQATINRSGFIKCKATKIGEDTTLSQIIKMVSDASATKAPVSKAADKVSGVFVPVVIIISLITLVVWLILGKGTGFSLARAISVLVISCPCALGLATPVAIMVASGVGAKCGILFKNAEALELTGKAKIVVFDKTGTITMGEPVVTDIISLNGKTEREVLEIACTLESKSEHPLSRAVMKKAEEENILPKESTGFEVFSGNGLKAVCENQILAGGNYEFINGFCEIEDSFKQKADELSNEGKTPLYFSCDGNLLGIIFVSDVIKPDSKSAIEELKNMGLRVYMLTGDNEKTAKAIAKKANITEVISSVKPDGKEKVISELKKDGKVIMVGDGINDAPALTSADIGIAIGAGSDVAIDAAEVVLMKSRLTDVVQAIKLSRKTLKNIYENLFWAFFYNVIGIPLAAGVFYALNLTLNPMFAAFAMSLSSFCVVSNALRLNLFKK